MVGITGNEIVAKCANESCRVGRLAESLMSQIGLAQPKIDAGVAGLAALLMTVRAVVVQISAGPIGNWCGRIVPACSPGDCRRRGKVLQVANARQMRELIF